MLISHTPIPYALIARSYVFVQITITHNQRRVQDAFNNNFYKSGESGGI